MNRQQATEAILTATLWIPYVVCQVMSNGFLAPANYVDPAPRPFSTIGQTTNLAEYLTVVAAGAAALWRYVLLPKDATQLS